MRASSVIHRVRPASAYGSRPTPSHVLAQTDAAYTADHLQVKNVLSLLSDVSVSGYTVDCERACEVLHEHLHEGDTVRYVNA